MDKRILILTLLPIIFLLSITAVSADDAFLLCLEDGQEIEFSECHSSMDDRRCRDTSCRYCVTEVSPGVYCPASPNECNSEGSQCIPLDVHESEEPILTLNSPTNFHEAEEGLVDFEFELTKSSQVNFCDLIIDDETVDQSLSPVAINELTAELFIGSYLWKIICETSSGDELESEVRTLSIVENIPDNNPPPNDGGNTNDGSSGGSSSRNSKKSSSTNNDLILNNGDFQEETLSLDTSLDLNKNTESSNGIFLIALSLMSIVNITLLLGLLQMASKKPTKVKGKKKK